MKLESNVTVLFNDMISLVFNFVLGAKHLQVYFLPLYIKYNPLFIEIQPAV